MDCLIKELRFNKNLFFGIMCVNFTCRGLFYIKNRRQVYLSSRQKMIYVVWCIVYDSVLHDNKGF